MASAGTVVRKLFAWLLFVVAFIFSIPVLAGDYNWFVSLVICLVTAFAGWWILRGVRKDAEVNEGAEAVKRRLAVLRLADDTDGSLTVTEVAAKLGWPLEVAQATLRSLDDGVRVVSTLTPEGIFLYEFLELVHDPTRPQNLRRSLAEREAAGADLAVPAPPPSDAPAPERALRPRRRK